MRISSPCERGVNGNLDSNQDSNPDYKCHVKGGKEF